MNKSNTFWIVATCIIVISTIIYIANGISNETYGDSVKKNQPVPKSTTSQSPPSTPPPPTQTYKVRSLPNGSSPFDACFGEWIQDGHATLTIKNSSSTDAIVCLHNTTHDYTLRNEYVQRNTSFLIDKIRQGHYKIRVWYGNNWNPALENSCNIKGNFESDLGFKESDEVQYFVDNDRGYTAASITLYTVNSENKPTLKISYSDIFKPSSSSPSAHQTTRSQYKGNQLPNGTSPFNECFGKAVYGGHATLTIKNDTNTDAIVCLHNVKQNRTIRNEYIKKNTSFRMDNIKQGYYKIRVFYGNDWNPTRDNPCGTKGNFESDTSFSEFDGQQYFEDNSKHYTVAAITLHTVEGGNAPTSKIKQEDFFNK